MGLRGYVLKRVVYSVILIFIVITINFGLFMIRSPLEMMGERAPVEVREALKVRFGLNESIPTRYFKYIQNLLTFQFGYSFKTGQEISQIFMEKLSNTLALCITAEILAVLLGLAIGVIAAFKRGKIVDSLSSVFSVITQGLPVFWIGLLLILVFSYSLGWFPPGHSEPEVWGIHGRPSNFLIVFVVRSWYLCLPVLTLVIISVGSYVLMTRASMLEVLSEDYLVTLKAKGLSDNKILFKHALKNASLPIITEVAIAFAFTLSGALVTETIFTYPGLGSWIWDSINYNDYPAMQAIFYLVSLCVIGANFIVDLVYGVVDPRIRY